MDNMKTNIDMEPICVPGNATLPVPGNTTKISNGQSYKIEQAVHHNLPNGLVVNNCYITPKGRWVSVL